MSDDLIGVIITASVSSIISIIGFVVTYSRNNARNVPERKNSSFYSNCCKTDIYCLDEREMRKKWRNRLQRFWLIHLHIITGNVILLELCQR